MKKISVRGILLFFALSVCLVFSLWTYLVSDTGDRYVNGIYVSELLRISSKRKYTANYCELLKKAIAKDANSIKQLTLLDFGDAAGYDHGTLSGFILKSPWSRSKTEPERLAAKATLGPRVKQNLRILAGEIPNLR